MQNYLKYGETDLFFYFSIEEILNNFKSKKYNTIFIFTDENVYTIYNEKITSIFSNLKLAIHWITFPSGENSKSIQQIIDLWHQLTFFHADRHSLLISFGGGVVNDITGFIASTYMRGIDFISIPTTLLCMVDASIGGKVGINFDKNKNLIGSFYQPKSIIICQEFLKTLPQEEFSSGLAEIIKIAVISNEHLFDTLEKSISFLSSDHSLLQNIIFESCKMKVSIVNSDTFEKKELRCLLNYGHTFGHAIESLLSFKISHGEAISIGMSCAAYVSKSFKFVDFSFIQRQDSLCRKAKLSTFLQVDIYALINQMKKDKKNISEKITLILPEKIGKVISLPEVSERIILESLFEKKENDAIH